MATEDQVKQAITAVKNGVATQQQQQWAAAAAKQAGSTGNQAREAFKGK
jgi:hypothetical protein